MPKLKKYQQYIIGALGSITLLAIGLAVLVISLYQTNRKSAASIKQITTEVVDYLK